MTRSARQGVTAWGIPAAVALVTFAAFLPALHAGFVAWDDQNNFLENLHYRGLGGAQLHWMWTTFLLGHYVPLSWMTLGLDYVLWGMNPAGYHLTSVVLHCANGVLLYFVARRLLRVAGAVRDESGMQLPAAAAFAALLFAVHPLRVESVVWVTERRDVLSGFFYLSSLLSYLRDAERTSSARRWYWMSLGLFLCALLSKATAVTLPAVLLILEVYPLRHLGGRAGWWSTSARSIYLRLAPFVVLAMATIVMTFVALQHVRQLAVPQKVAVSAYSLAFYLWKTLVPVNLSPLYDMPQRIDPAEARYVASYAVAIGLSVLAWVVRRRRPAVAIAWLAFVVILFPLLGVHQNGPQIAADRYTYDAAPALAILAAAAWTSLARPLSVVPGTIAGAIVVCLGALTWKQSEVWHDSATMWSHVLSLNPRSSTALTAAGNLEANAGQTDSAIVYFQRSLAIDPSSPEAENNLGIALSRQRRFNEAVEHFQRAVSLKDRYYEAENNWGLTIAEAGGDLGSAIEHYRTALEMNAEYADAHVNWGNALVLSGNFDGAIEQYRQALAIRPDDADAHRNWGVALARQGNMKAAITHFQEALALRPDFSDARNLLDRAIQLQSSHP
jgi:protein O-mannosyl-transferase